MASFEAGGRFTKTGKKSVVRIHFLDNEFKTIAIDETTSAADVCQMVADKIGVAESIHFALFESITHKTGRREDRCLDGSEFPAQVMLQWAAGSRTAKWVFKRKIFLESKMVSKDPMTNHLLYIQAVDNIINGTYPCDIETAIKLAAVQMQVNFGDHKRHTHQVGFLLPRLVEYLPPYHLTQDNTKLCQSILEQHALLTADAPTVADSASWKALYLQEAQQIPVYGCRFFLAKQTQFKKLPANVLIGVNAQGLHILRADSKARVVCWSFRDLQRWGTKPGISVFFQTKSRSYAAEGPIYEFSTSEAHRIQELLNIYVMAMLEEISPMLCGPPAPETHQIELRFDSYDHDSAVKIQAAVRGYLLRTLLDRAERTLAAIFIQSIWRGHSTRKHVTPVASRRA
eukprot:GILK01007581.1.p1 GENE.GILK01007581.1~~GILK01007581.1.p1  ORF type:complete len:411 (-),score=36.35 GILK01007581.1:362-1561(-)